METPNNPETKKNKFWNFTAKNEQTNTPAELVLYGDISSRTSWFDDVITPRQFDADLKALGDVDEITVRINSGGGDVFAANAIYTRLKDHKAKINVKIDGWAASAATIIAMAGDTIQIPANGVFMIHNPQIGLVGYYGVNDFAKLSEELTVIKQSIMQGYCTKTGKSESEISELMDKETWLDGGQAVENGFCTGLMFEDVQTEVENESRIVVNSVPFDLTEFANIPKSLLNRFISPAQSDFTNKADTQKPKQGGVVEMDIKTVDQLEKAYPELTAEIKNAAAAAERERIKDIESVAVNGFEDIVTAAKFDNPISSGEVAIQIIAKQKEQGKKAIADIDSDVQSSGVNDVVPSTSNSDNNDAENPYMAAIDKMLPVGREG